MTELGHLLFPLITVAALWACIHEVRAALTDLRRTRL